MVTVISFSDNVVSLPVLILLRMVEVGTLSSLLCRWAKTKQLTSKAGSNSSFIGKHGKTPQACLTTKPENKGFAKDKACLPTFVRKIMGTMALRRGFRIPAYLRGR